jgi:hypothetical protein
MEDKGNACLGCRFGSVKLEILVPENCDITEFAKQTQNFRSEIVAMTKEKPMHYSLTFGSADPASKLDFKVHCICILNMNKKECAKFSESQEKEPQVKLLVYSKPSTSERIEIKMEQ